MFCVFSLRFRILRYHESCSATYPLIASTVGRRHLTCGPMLSNCFASTIKALLDTFFCGVQNRQHQQSICQRPLYKYDQLTIKFTRLCCFRYALRPDCPCQRWSASSKSRFALNLIILSYNVRRLLEKLLTFSVTTSGETRTSSDFFECIKVCWTPSKNFCLHDLCLIFRCT